MFEKMNVEKINQVCRSFLTMCEKEGLTMSEMERVISFLKFDISSMNEKIKEITSFRVIHDEEEHNDT